MVGKGDRGRAQCGGAHLRSWSAQDQAKALPGSIAPSGQSSNASAVQRPLQLCLRGCAELQRTGRRGNRGFATSSPATSCGPPGAGGLDRLRARQGKLTSAIMYAQQLVQLTPNDPSTKAMLAELLGRGR